MSADQQFDTEGRYVARTGDMVVRVKPIYLPNQSEPDQNRYVWAYEVTIENEGDETVQLLDRYWHITDGNGRVEEVEGPGVIGKQPILKPGQNFTYASGCPLTTPSGIMVGHYMMLSGDGNRFTIAIPAFSLDLPRRAQTLN
ncbi:MAG: Co2+/Mg2+ efflux protein ApaG [Minwuia sp.]|nr:Co2+/Mg2+ efflux protein ApaG [Minwuia sp.]